MIARFSGLVAALAYALHRAKVGFLRLRVGAMVICCLCAGYAACQGWRTGFAFSRFVAITLSLLLVAALLWANQRHYIVFREHDALDIRAAELKAEEKLFLRGSGTFEVSDMNRYLVEVPVVFWTTQLAEHVLAAKVRALSFLGIGVPSEERGWWYIFLEPNQVVEVTPGHLCFGFGLRPAVRVQRKAQKGRQFVYLSCDSVEQQATVLNELLARAQATSQGAT